MVSLHSLYDIFIQSLALHVKLFLNFFGSISVFLSMKDFDRPLTMLNKV